MRALPFSAPQSAVRGSGRCRGLPSGVSKDGLQHTWVSRGLSRRRRPGKKALFLRGRLFVDDSPSPLLEIVLIVDATRLAGVLGYMRCYIHSSSREGVSSPTGCICPLLDYRLSWSPNCKPSRLHSRPLMIVHIVQIPGHCSGMAVLQFMIRRSVCRTVGRTVDKIMMKGNTVSGTSAIELPTDNHLQDKTSSRRAPGHSERR